MDAIAFRAIIGFLYTGTLEIPFEHSYVGYLLCKQCKFENLMKLLEKHRNNATSDLILINTDRSCEELELEFQSDFQNLHKLISSPNPYADLIFKVESVDFFCHKMFFCERSEYFKAMLMGYFQEAEINKEINIPVITLSSLSATSFTLLSQYVYTGNLENIEDHSLLFEMLAVSEEFLLYNLKNKVERQLCAAIDLEDLWDFFEASKLYSLVKLVSFLRFCIAYLAIFVHFFKFFIFY